MEYLAISIFGDNRAGVINEVIQLISHCDCNIEDCRMITLGQQFCANVLLSGNWNAIAKLETQLPYVEKKLNLKSISQRTQAPKKQKDILPYGAFVTVINQPGVIARLTQFFSEQDIEINELYSDNYAAKFSGISMATVTMSVSVHQSIPVSDLRDRFMLFCEQYNFDGVIEPEKA